MGKTMKLSAAGLEEALPHGSGIDCDWRLTDRPTYFKAENAYHCMNETGFYCGWADFSVVVPKSDPLDFRLHFHGGMAQRLCRRNGLREYLEDILSEALRDMPDTT